MESKIENVKEVLGKDLTKDFLVAEKEGDEYEFYKVNLSPDVLDTLEEKVKRKLELQGEKIEDGDAVYAEYSSTNGRKDEHHIQEISLDEVPEFDKMSEMTNKGEFSAEKIEGLDPEVQCFRLKSSDGVELIALRKFTNNQIVGTGKLNVFWKDDSYTEFKDNLVQLPEKFDLLIWGKKAIILGPRNFERIFNFMEEFRKAAKEVSNHIEDSDIEVGEHEKVFEKIEDHNRVVRKMHEVNENEYYRDMTMEDMSNRIEEYDIDGVKIHEDDEGNEKLEVTDFRKIWDFVKLLNDDFLLSNVTENKYGVSSKEER